MKCEICEDLPKPTLIDGYLYIKPAIKHTAVKLFKALKKSQYNVLMASDTALIVKNKPSQNHDTAILIDKTLSYIEKKDAVAFITENPNRLKKEELLNTLPLNRLIARLSSSWVVEILKSGKHQPYYQPIVDVKKRIIGYESLFRAYDKDNNLVLPGDIFPLAEKSNLLFYLDREARVNAIRQGRFISDDNLMLFINFNPSSIYDPTFCLNTTNNAAEKSDFNKEKIVFEVVETEQVKDYNYLESILSQYKDFGFKVALDDVGSGYNSLDVISRIKPDIIKLDLNLIRNIDANTINQNLVRNLIDSCQKFGILCLAEGVESEAEYQYLASIGIDYLQGYFFGKPNPNDFYT